MRPCRTPATLLSLLTPGGVLASPTGVEHGGLPECKLALVYLTPIREFLPAPGGAASEHVFPQDGLGRQSLSGVVSRTTYGAIQYLGHLQGRPEC